MNYDEKIIISEIKSNLEDFAKQHELDPVTTNSLLNGSLVMISPNEEKASVMLINPNKTSGLSINYSNIKFNLKFALGSIFAFKPILDAQGIWLILYVLKTILFLWDELTVDINKTDALILFVLYRKDNLAKKDILDYIKDICSEEALTIKDIDKSLLTLEEIKAVSLINGKYCLSETIIFL